MAGKDLVVRRVTNDNGDRRVMELFRTRLDLDDEVELTEEEVDTAVNPTTAQPAAKEPTDGLVTEAVHETVHVVTWFRSDDEDRPSARKAKPKRKSTAKKTAAKKTTRKKTAAKKTTAKK